MFMWFEPRTSNWSITPLYSSCKSSALIFFKIWLSENWKFVASCSVKIWSSPYRLQPDKNKIKKDDLVAWKLSAKQIIMSEDCHTHVWLLMLACRATCYMKAQAWNVVPLVACYWTACLLCPAEASVVLLTLGSLMSKVKIVKGPSRLLVSASGV